MKKPHVDSGLTAALSLATMRSMIETISFCAGIGFSLLVYVLSIRKSSDPWHRKALYFFFTLIGITGTLFLSGVLIAHFLREWGYMQ